MEWNRKYQCLVLSTGKYYIMNLLFPFPVFWVVNEVTGVQYISYIFVLLDYG